MAALDSVDAERDSAIEKRTVRAHATLKQLRGSLDGLQKDPSEPYAVQLKHEVEQYLREVADAQSAFEDVVERSAESLRRVRPPGRWKERHQRHVSKVDSYLAALRSLRATLEHGNDEQIRESAEAMSTRQNELDRSTAEYLRELGDQYLGRRAYGLGQRS